MVFSITCTTVKCMKSRDYFWNLKIILLWNNKNNKLSGVSCLLCKAAPKWVAGFKLVCLSDSYEKNLICVLFSIKC